MKTAVRGTWMHLVLIFLPTSQATYRRSPHAKIIGCRKYLGIFPLPVKVPNEGRSITISYTKCSVIILVVTVSGRALLWANSIAAVPWRVGGGPFKGDSTTIVFEKEFAYMAVVSMSMRLSVCSSPPPPPPPTTTTTTATTTTTTRTTATRTTTTTATATATATTTTTKAAATTEIQRESKRHVHYSAPEMQSTLRARPSSVTAKRMTGCL